MTRRTEHLRSVWMMVKKNPETKTKKKEIEARRAKALRANLKRRKLQQQPDRGRGDSSN